MVTVLAGTLIVQTQCAPTSSFVSGTLAGQSKARALTLYTAAISTRTFQMFASTALTLTAQHEYRCAHETTRLANEHYPSRI